MTRHRLALVATVVVAGSALSACGSTPAPAGAPTPSVATTSASPTPTATTAPLSAFEDRAPVKAIRAMFDAQARAVNRRSLALPQLTAVLTPAGRRLLDPAVRSDFGLRYPGPIPFTPTRVDIAGSTATVLGCMVGHGFAVKPATGKPAGARTVYAIKVSLVRSATSWKVDSLFLDQSTSCRGVHVQGVTW